MLCPTIVSDFENNLILYFFSAMPQVLGTMLALLGAFYPSRSGVIRNEIVDKFNSTKLCLREFNGSGGFGFKDEKSILRERVFPHEIEIVDKIYRLEKNEIILLDQIRIFIIEKWTDSEIEEINKSSSKLIAAYFKAVEDFNSRKFKLLEDYIKSQDKTHNPSNMSFLGETNYLDNPDFYDILRLLKSNVSRIQLLNSMKKCIKEVFIFNGFILLLFILSFLFLNLTANSILIHKMFLTIGAVLAAISAYSMIYYVYNSVSENAQTSLFGLNLRRRCKNLFLWVKGKWEK